MISLAGKSYIADCCTYTNPNPNPNPNPIPNPNRPQYLPPRYDKDLVVAVGGDGTILNCASFLGSDIPLLGVNSDPNIVSAKPKNKEDNRFVNLFTLTLTLTLILTLTLTLTKTIYREDERRSTGQVTLTPTLTLTPISFQKAFPVPEHWTSS